MNVIFISPNYPAGHWKYVEALRNAGHTVLGIGDAGDETFSPLLRGNLTEYYRVGDLHDHESVWRACGYYISRYGVIGEVINLNPYWDDLAASLRSAGLLGLADPATFYARSEADRAGAAYLPQSVTANTQKAAADFAAEHGYPVLLSPTEDKRLGRRRAEDAKQLRAIIKQAPAGAYRIYPIYEGENFRRLSVDALCDRSGGVIACSAHTVSDGYVISAALSDDEQTRISDIAAGYGACGFIHIDAVRCEKAAPGIGRRGELVITDICVSPGHEYVIDCMNAEYGADLRAIWAGMIGCDKDISPIERQSLACAVTRSFDRSYKNAHERIFGRLREKLIYHGRTQEADRADWGDYVYIFRAGNTAEARRNIKFITEDFS